LSAAKSGLRWFRPIPGTFSMSPATAHPVRERTGRTACSRGIEGREQILCAGRFSDTATAEDLRRFQLHQTQSGMQPPNINSAVSALRFFFTVTLDRPDLARRLTVVRRVGGGTAEARG
jgi:hypothetical protein